MRTKEFELKRVVLKTFDNEDGQWNTIMTEILLCEIYQKDTYLGNSEIFRWYEKLMQEYYGRKEKYPKHTIEKPICEIDTIAYRIEESEVDVIKKIFSIEGESKYLKTIYNRVQHYGGSEEGGWFYHTLEATSHNVNDFTEEDLETDRYGEGLDVYQEFYFGQHEKLEREHYC